MKLHLMHQLDKKPRTYRQIARRDYLEVAKKRRIFQKQRSKAIKKQLQYIKRNLSHIEQLTLNGATILSLTNRQYKMLLVVTEVYRQQLWLSENKKQSIDDHIGVPLGRPPANISKEKKQQAKEDERIRNSIEGKFGAPVRWAGSPT